VTWAVRWKFACATGTGIGDEVRDKIFEPFFTTKPAGEGTGLGLSLSYDIIVKQHGGQLTVDSRPNEFTEFQIILPRRTAANEGGPCMTVRVLVVDDEPDVEVLFRQQFRSGQAARAVGSAADSNVAV
jgi:hypothetical protein